MRRVRATAATFESVGNKISFRHSGSCAAKGKRRRDTCTLCTRCMVSARHAGLVTAILAHVVPECGAGLSKVFSQVSKGGIMISQDILDIFRLKPGKKV